MFAKQARQLGLERTPSGGAQTNGSSSRSNAGPEAEALPGSGQSGDLDRELEDMLRLTVGMPYVARSCCAQRRTCFLGNERSSNE